jgi:hypothetical protein
MQQKLKGCIERFEKEETSMLCYEAVRRTFDGHPRNVDKADVLLKFIVLNNLYWTNIWARYAIVEHIHKLAIQEDLDKFLKSGNLEAINKIRKGHGIRVKRTRKERNFYSFATKYCHFSNPQCYPIYDQYVDKAIMKLRKSSKVQFHRQDELYEPKGFKSIIDQIIQRFGLADYQQADRALYVYGGGLTRARKKP